jgi:hypothetical protein
MKNKQVNKINKNRINFKKVKGNKDKRRYKLENKDSVERIKEKVL